MVEKNIEPVSMSNTKKEILESYNTLLKKLEEKEKNKLDPKAKIDEKNKVEIITKADKFLSVNLKEKINILTNDVSESFAKINSEIENLMLEYKNLREAIKFRENQLHEIYEIEKTIHSFIALVEAQKNQKDNFEKEMQEAKNKYETELAILKETWKKEKDKIEQEKKEFDETEKNRKKRLQEDFNYNFERQKKTQIDKFNDEQKKTQKDFLEKVAKKEAELTLREQKLKESEDELMILRKKVSEYDKNLESSIEKVKKEITKQKDLEFNFEKQLLAKQFEIDTKVSQSKITTLEKTVTAQEIQIKSLSQKLDSSYDKIQHVAEKAIESSSKNSNIPQMTLQKATE